MRPPYPVYILARADKSSQQATCDYSVGDVFFTCPSKRVMLLVTLGMVTLPRTRGLCEEHGEHVWKKITESAKVDLYHAGEPVYHPPLTVIKEESVE